MRVGAFQFEPSWIATLAMVPLLGLLMWLGTWQLGRAATKQVLIDAQASFANQEPAEVAKLPPGAKAPRHQRMNASGAYDDARQFLLDNRTHKGQAGYYVLTPLNLQDGTALIINRGWIPTGPDRARLPDISIVADTLDTSATGHIHHPAEKQLLLGPSGYALNDWPRVIQRVEFAAIAEALSATVRPFTLRLDAQAPHGYARNWPVHYGITPDRHHAYAFQWFSLAVALVTIYIVVNTRKVETT